MESKSIEEYFSKAKKLPLAMTFADVQSLVSAKGVSSSPKRNWWNLKNIIIMTITTILTTAILVSILSLDSTDNGKYFPESNSFENIQEINSKEGEKPFVDNQLIENQVNELVSNEVILNGEDQESPTELVDIDFSMISNSENQSRGSIGFSKYYGSPASKKLVPLINKKVKEPNYDSKTGLVEIEGETKTVTESIDVTDLKNFTLTNKFGNIHVESWDEPTVEVTAHFTLETKDNEDAEKGLESFKIKLITEGKNVSVTNNWADYNNCSDNANNSSGNKRLFNLSSQNSFTTDQGEKIKYKNFKIEYLVKIPKYFNVNLSNSYANIEMQSIEGKANIEIFQGNLFADNMKELLLNLKYGTAEANNITIGVVESFQSTFSLGNAEKLKLGSKYSDVNIGGVEDLNLKGFQSNLVANGEVKNLEGNWKYGKIELLRDSKNIKLTAFQSSLIAQNIEKLYLSMKYGKLTAKTINQLEIPEGFQSKFKITNVGDIQGNLKYSPVEINVLKNSLDINSFNGNVEVNNIESGFKSVDLETKYTNVSLNFDENASYRLKAKTKYSKLTVPDGFRNVRELSIANRGVEDFSGTLNGTGVGEVSVVSLDCFDGRITLD